MSESGGSLATVPAAIVGLMTALYVGHWVWVNSGEYSVVIRGIGALIGLVLGFKAGFIVTMVAIIIGLVLFMGATIVINKAT